MASAVLTFAISLKAGGLLLLPTMLGMIQYHYGIKTLMKAIGVIFIWQYLLVGMFYHEFVGGETGMWFYFKLAKFTGNSEVGAAWENNIFWRFLGYENYVNNESFIQNTQMGMLALNVYIFFIHHGCLPKCL